MVKPESVYIAFEVFPRPKGASSHIASMVSALKKIHKPVLLLCLGFGELPSFQKEDNIIIERYRIYHPNMLKRAEGFGQFVYTALDHWKKNLKLCVFRDPWGGHPALSLGADYKTIFEVNALPSWELGYTYPDFPNNHSLKNKIEDLEYYCLNNAGRILTVSPVTEQQLILKGVDETKITTIPNSAPEIFFSRDIKGRMPDALQPELYETTDKTMGNQRWIGYFGSLHPWQGVEDAIDAFSMIAGSFEDVKMMIITGGKKEVRKQIRKRIRKLGLEAKIIIHHPMQQALLAKVISRMEFTLAPLKETPRNTIQGCCPVKIIESMATGTPVIASGLSCVSSLISHQKDGWLVPAGNSRAFALAMKTLLQSKELVSSLSENARLTASYNFHQSIIHKHLCNFFTNTTH